MDDFHDVITAGRRAMGEIGEGISTAIETHGWGLYRDLSFIELFLLAGIPLAIVLPPYFEMVRKARRRMLLDFEVGAAVHVNPDIGLIASFAHMQELPANRRSNSRGFFAWLLIPPAIFLACLFAIWALGRPS